MYHAKYPTAILPLVFEQDISTIGGADLVQYVIEDAELPDVDFDAFLESAYLSTSSAETGNLYGSVQDSRGGEHARSSNDSSDQNGDFVGQGDQRLEARMQDLAQRLNRPTQQQRAVESVLRMVWEAFQATGLPQAQPDSALWNLVMSVTPGAIRSNSLPPMDIPHSTAVQFSDGFGDTADIGSDSSLPLYKRNQSAAQRRADSAYHSG